MHHLRPRIDLDTVAPGAEDAVGTLDTFVARLDLERPLLELVRLRASQLNGCHLCLAMHARDARTAGVPQRKLDVVAAWREAPGFTERERAALAWAEAVTLVSSGQVPDAVYEAARQQLDEQELAALTLAVVAINSWNRLAISLRMVPSPELAGVA